MGVIIEEQNLQNQVLDAVRVFDDEETGYISVDELKEAFEQMPGRNKVRDFELRDILRKADPNQEGKISTKGGQTPGCLHVSVSVVCPLLLLISTSVCLSLYVSLSVPLSVQSPSLYLLLPGNNLFLFFFFLICRFHGTLDAFYWPLLKPEPDNVGQQSGHSRATIGLFSDNCLS